MEKYDPHKAVSLLGTIEANVNNVQLSDFEFRQFIRNSLPVAFVDKKTVKEAIKKRQRKQFPDWCITKTEMDTRRLLGEQLGVKPELIGRETHLVDELGADSLDMVEVIMVLEQHFKIDIRDEVYEKIEWKVSAIIEMVNKIQEEQT